MQRNLQGGGMEQFGRFEIENSISEIVPRVFCGYSICLQGYVAAGIVVDTISAAEV